MRRASLLADWPEPLAEGIDPAVEEEWDLLLMARQGVLRGLEAARGKGIIGHPLDADVQVKLSDYYKPLAGRISDETWENILIVSGCHVVDEISGAENVYEDETTGSPSARQQVEGREMPALLEAPPRSRRKGYL